MTKIETIFKVLCLFFITLLITSCFFFYLFVGSPSTTVNIFGFIIIPLWKFYILAISVSLLLTIILAWVTYRQLKREQLYMSARQIVFYSLVVGMGITFLFITHSFLLPVSSSLQVFILDIAIIIELALMSGLLTLSVLMARADVVITDVASQYKHDKRKVRDLINSVEDALYELEKRNAHPVKRFFLDYIAHHFWVGVGIFIVGIITLVVSTYVVGSDSLYGVSVMWCLLGTFLMVDDIINHLFHKSITKLFPKRLKNERSYDKVGKVFCVFFLVVVLVVVLLGLYAYLILGLR